MLQTGWLKWQKVIFSQFWRLEVQNQGAQMVGFWWELTSCFMVYIQPPSCLSIHGGDREVGGGRICLLMDCFLAAQNFRMFPQIFSFDHRKLPSFLSSHTIQKFPLFFKWVWVVFMLLKCLKTPDQYWDCWGGDESKNTVIWGINRRWENSVVVL